MRVDNVVKHAVLLHEAEVVVDHVGVVGIGPEADSDAFVVDAGYLGLRRTQEVFVVIVVLVIIAG